MVKWFLKYGRGEVKEGIHQSEEASNVLARPKLDRQANNFCFAAITWYICVTEYHRVATEEPFQYLSSVVMVYKLSGCSC